MDSISKSPTQKCVRTYFRSFPKMPPPPPQTPTEWQKLQIVFYSSCKFPEEQSWRMPPIPQESKLRPPHRRRKSLYATDRKGLSRFSGSRRWKAEEKGRGGIRRATAPSHCAGHSAPPPWRRAGASRSSGNLSHSEPCNRACHTTSLEREVQPNWQRCFHSLASFTLSPSHPRRSSVQFQTHLQSSCRCRPPDGQQHEGKSWVSDSLSLPTACAQGDTVSLITTTLPKVQSSDICQGWMDVETKLDFGAPVITRGGLFRVDVPLW